MGNILGRSNRVKQTKVILELLVIVYIVRRWRVSSPDTLLGQLDSALWNWRPWQVVLSTLGVAHLMSNLSLMLGLNAPHRSLRSGPELKYSPSFSRVRWFLTAFDAGVLSTRNIRNPLLRDTMSFILGLYYMVFSSKAETKVQMFQAQVTPELVKSMWEKGSHPVLKLADSLMAPKIRVDGREVHIPRADGSLIRCLLFFDGSEEQLAASSRLVLQFPGGGFIAMGPEHHASYIRRIALELKVPILSVDYRKAPQFPFPAQFLDCYDVYTSVVDSNGSSIGMNLSTPSSSSPLLSVALMGDSAGGNLVAAVTLRSLVTGYRVPKGVHLIYPVLEMSMHLWRPAHHVRMEGNNTVVPVMEASRDSLVDRALGKPRLRGTTHTANTNTHATGAAAAAAAASIPTASTVTSSGAGAGSGSGSGSGGAQAPGACSPAGGLVCDSSSSSSSSASLVTAATTACVVGTPGAAGLAANNVYSAANTTSANTIATLRPPDMASRARFASDAVLPFRYQLLIGKALFRGGGDPTADMYASPLLASDELLARFPATFVHVGEVDPLVDDSVELCNRIRRSNPATPVKLMVIPGVSHAYMNVTALLPEGQEALMRSVTWLREIFELPTDTTNRDSTLNASGSMPTAAAHLSPVGAGTVGLPSGTSQSMLPSASSLSLSTSTSASTSAPASASASSLVTSSPASQSFSTSLKGASGMSTGLNAVSSSAAATSSAGPSIAASAVRGHSFSALPSPTFVPTRVAEEATGKLLDGEGHAVISVVLRHCPDNLSIVSLQPRKRVEVTPERELSGEDLEVDKVAVDVTEMMLSNAYAITTIEGNATPMVSSVLSCSSADEADAQEVMKATATLTPMMPNEQPPQQRELLKAKL